MNLKPKVMFKGKSKRSLQIFYWGVLNNTFDQNCVTENNRNPYRLDVLEITYLEKDDSELDVLEITYLEKDDSELDVLEITYLEKDDSEQDVLEITYLEKDDSELDVLEMTYLEKDDSEGSELFSSRLTSSYISILKLCILKYFV